MTESKNEGGTPLRDQSDLPAAKFKVGDKVWSRLDEKLATVEYVRRSPISGQMLYWLDLRREDGEVIVRRESDLARKEPSVQMFQARETDDEFLDRVISSGAARPSSSRFPIFRVAELVSGPEPIGKRFFVVETTLTSDGPRDRICDGRWDTEQQAQDECARRKERANGKV